MIIVVLPLLKYVFMSNENITTHDKIEHNPTPVISQHDIALYISINSDINTPWLTMSCVEMISSFFNTLALSVRLQFRCPRAPRVGPKNLIFSNKKHEKMRKECLKVVKWLPGSVPKASPKNLSFPTRNSKKMGKDRHEAVNDFLGLFPKLARQPYFFLQ